MLKYNIVKENAYFVYIFTSYLKWMQKNTEKNQVHLVQTLRRKYEKFHDISRVYFTKIP
jgi:hypothetical protein